MFEKKLDSFKKTVNYPLFFRDMSKANKTIESSSYSTNMTSNDTILAMTCIFQINFNPERQLEDVDDFEELFDNLSIKIASGIICFALLTFTNTFNILVSIFEKYGGDPLKRSLKNQLISQLGYSMIINNTLCNPIITSRYRL